MARSVILLDDQHAGRLPSRCVLSGAPTNGAVRVRAVAWSGPRWVLGIPGAVPLIALRPRRSHRVALPIARAVWRTWRRRDRAALCGIAAGLAFVVGGIVRDGGLAALGALVVVLSAAYRTRAAHNYWFTCRLDPARGVVTVEPTHPEFDKAARELFTRSLRR